VSNTLSLLHDPRNQQQSLNPSSPHLDHRYRRALELLHRQIEEDEVAPGIETTPLEFARIHSGFDVSNTLSLLHDPRNQFRATSRVK
jgi:hypothetical protein